MSNKEVNVFAVEVLEHKNRYKENADALAEKSKAMVDFFKPFPVKVEQICPVEGIYALTIPLFAGDRVLEIQAGNITGSIVILKDSKFPKTTVASYGPDGLAVRLGKDFAISALQQKK